MVDGKKDGAWDVFTYNLPSGSGQFLKDGMTFPYDPLVKINTSLGVNGNYSFYISTKDGLVYSFTEGDRKVFKHRKYYTDQNTEWIPVANSNAQWNTDSMEYIATWNVNNIISSHYKDTVFFNYTLKNYNRTRTFSTEALPLHRKASMDDNGQIYTPSNSYDMGYPIISQTRIRTSQHHRLSSIGFPNGRILFSYDESSDQLMDITIQQKAGGSYNTIKYFDFERTGNQLITLNVYGSQNRLIGEWGFIYNDDNVGTITDPDNKAQDYWGFYNGATSNNTLLSLDSNLFLLANKHYPINGGAYQFPVKRREGLLYYGLVSESNIDNMPPNIQNYYVNFADRKFHFDAAVKGTLKTVILPTGASVRYEYEPNQFYQIFNPTDGEGGSKVMQGGGLRIKSISTFDEHDSLIVRKEYHYGLDDPEKTQLWETGYGFMTRPGNVLAVNDVYMTGSSTGNVQSLLLLSHPVNDMVLYDGSYVVYETVGEYIYSDTTCNGGSIFFYDFGAPDGAWDISNPYLSTSLSIPSFYVNSGIRNTFYSGIPVKKLILTYNKHYNELYSIKEIHNHLINSKIQTSVLNHILQAYRPHYLHNRALWVHFAISLQAPKLTLNVMIFMG